MNRMIASVAMLLVVACACSAQEKPAFREIMALEQAVQELLRVCEPTVGCVLVSRNDIYARQWDDRPPADNPGKLGGFDPSSKQVPQQFQPNNNMRGGRGFLRGGNPFFNRNPTVERDRETAEQYDLADPTYLPEAFGSCVVIDAREQLVLTPYHVIRDATKIYVRLPGDKGSYADIRAADPRSDLAVLKLLDDRVQPLQEIKLGDATKAKKGQFVATLANPYAAGFRDGSPSISLGLLSNIRQRIPRHRNEEDAQALAAYGMLLQTDTRLNLGSSGGAMVNLRGEMIGLLSSKAALSGMEIAGGFATPIDHNTLRILQKLKAGLEVEYGFLGVRPRMDADGLHIIFDLDGTPARRAGIGNDPSYSRDVLVSINGIPVQTPDDLFLTIATQMAGTKVRLKFRDRPQEVPVVLVKSYYPVKPIFTYGPAAVRGMRVDYASVLHNKTRSTRAMPTGVYISEVAADSPAASVRVQVNDVITKVNGREVTTPAEFYAESSKHPQKEPLEITIAGSDGHRPTAATTLVIP